MKGYPHLLFVLVLAHASVSLLAGLGESVFMGSPVYLVVPVLRGALLLGAAVAAGRTGPVRRWPLVVLIVTAQVAVAGYLFSNLLGVLPWVSDTINLVGVLTNLALPLSITWLAARLLAARRRPPAPPPAVITPVPVLPRTVLVPAPPRTVPDPLAHGPAVPMTKVLPSGGA